MTFIQTTVCPGEICPSTLNTEINDMVFNPFLFRETFENCGMFHLTKGCYADFIFSTQEITGDPNKVHHFHSDKVKRPADMTLKLLGVA